MNKLIFQNCGNKEESNMDISMKIEMVSPGCQSNVDSEQLNCFKNAKFSKYK